MKRALMYIAPSALFALWIWIIVLGIDEMTAQEKNNRFHAMLLNCEHRGRLDGVPDVLVFDCEGRVELHQEIKWNKLN